MQTYLTSRLLGFTVASPVAVLAPAGAFGLTDPPLSAAQPNANGAGSIIEEIVFASTRDRNSFRKERRWTVRRLVESPLGLGC